MHRGNAKVRSSSQLIHEKTVITLLSKNLFALFAMKKVQKDL
jgi:hypothetical protein